MSAKIAMALHQVMSKVSYVQKGGTNKFHGYKYAGEADLLAVLRPAMIEAGLILLPSVVECRPVDEHGNTTVIMEYTLAHKDGEVWPHPIRMAGTGHDKTKSGVQDKGTYKAITGCNKYLLFKLFQIETGDDPEHDERPAHTNGNGASKTGLVEDEEWHADAWREWATGTGAHDWFKAFDADMRAAKKTTYDGVIAKNKRFLDALYEYAPDRYGKANDVIKATRDHFASRAPA